MYLTISEWRRVNAELRVLSAGSEALISDLEQRPNGLKPSDLNKQELGLFRLLLAFASSHYTAHGEPTKAFAFEGLSVPPLDPS